MAKQMGVPFGYLCSGTNINDITYRVMKTGKFHKSDKMERTLSEALNIQLVRTVRGTIHRLGAPNYVRVPFGKSLAHNWRSTAVQF